VSVSVSEPVICVVEVPRGSRNKYEYDEERGAIRLDRTLPASLTYPVDYGFIDETLGRDDDPLDAMLRLAEPVFPGCVVAARVIALCKMEDEEGVDHTVLCVPWEDPAFEEIQGLDDVSAQFRDEIAHFFSVYKDLEPEKCSRVGGWLGREDALREIADARARYRDSAD
jgi:inorganic pyrophosphatase